MAIRSLVWLQAIIAAFSFVAAAQSPEQQAVPGDCGVRARQTRTKQGDYVLAFTLP